MLLPDQFVLPDFVAGDVGGVLALHDPLERLVIETVEMSLAQAFGPFVDQSVEVVGLLQVEIELAADRFVDFAQDRFHMGLEVLVGLVATQLGDQRIEQTEAVAQFLGGCAHGGIDVAGGEAVDGQRMDQA